MQNEIFITGCGVISAIGEGKEETLRSLLGGRSGIGSLRYLKTVHDLPCGEVKLSDDDLKGLLGIPSDRIISRNSLLGIYAVKEAAAEAGVTDFSRAALISGTTVGGMEITEDHFLEAISSDDEAPLLQFHSCGDSTDDIASYFGGFSFATTVTTACSSAANAIIFGERLIQSGRFDTVITGGCECLTRYHLNGFNALKILDSERCRPFDATRSGLNLGEGAGFVVLQSARALSLKPLAVLSGYGNACDAFHQTASSENGEGAYLAMTKAIAMAGLSPSDISYINAHGTGTVNNDASESSALRRVFGESVPPVSSTKSFTGHTTSASGGIETVFCLLAMLHGFIPANLGWATADPACVKPCPSVRTGVTLRHVLCNAFAFGGNDSSLLFSAIDSDLR